MTRAAFPSTLAPKTEIRVSRTLISSAATLVVLGLAYAPLLWRFFVQQWARPHYQYFPFVLGAFAWLFWRNSKKAQPRVNRRPTLTKFCHFVFSVLAWSTLALAYLANSPWLAVVSAILLVASRFVVISAVWRIDYLWGIWAMLWLIVPAPMNRDQHLILWLQKLSSKFSSILLDWIGVDHLMEGNALLLPGKQFFVDEACSGIVSVLSVIACAVIFGLWQNRSVFHVIALAISGIGWATLMNVLRISAIAIAYDCWGLDWSVGTVHEILGLVIFTIVFLALVSMDYLLAAVLAPIAGRDGELLGEPIEKGITIVAAWDRLLQWGAPQYSAGAMNEPIPREMFLKFVAQLPLGAGILFTFAALSAAQLAIPFVFKQPEYVNPHGFDRALALHSDALNAEFKGLKKIGFEHKERNRSDVFGQYSQIFEFRDEKGNLYLASCDFPFGPDWHDLTACYLSVGWNLTDMPKFCPQAKQGEASWDHIEANFIKPDGSTAQLAYCAFDENGRFVDPPTRSFFSDIWRSLQKQYRKNQTQHYFQLQVWTTSNGRLSEDQIARARELLIQMREPLRRFISEPESAASLMPRQ
jgi:exosortase